MSERPPSAELRQGASPYWGPCPFQLPKCHRYQPVYILDFKKMLKESLKQLKNQHFRCDQSLFRSFSQSPMAEKYISKKP